MAEGSGLSSQGCGLCLGVRGGFQTHRGPGGNHRGTVLFNAFDQRLGTVAEAEGRLERVAVLQVAEREVVLDLFGDAVHPVTSTPITRSTAKATRDSNRETSRPGRNSACPFPPIPPFDKRIRFDTLSSDES